jgi:hypothetical protein
MKEQMRCDNCRGFLGTEPIMMESGRGLCKGCCYEATEVLKTDKAVKWFGQKEAVQQ